MRRLSSYDACSVDRERANQSLMKYGAGNFNCRHLTWNSSLRLRLRCQKSEDEEICFRRIYLPQQIRLNFDSKTVFKNVFCFTDKSSKVTQQKARGCTEFATRRWLEGKSLSKSTSIWKNQMRARRRDRRNCSWYSWCISINRLIV